jgi:pilus assembly protein CpaF
MTDTPPYPGIDKQDLGHLKNHLIELIRAELETGINSEGNSKKIQELLNLYYQSLKIELPGDIRDAVFKTVIDELLGMGVLQPLLEDPEISEIMVNGRDQVYIEIHGILKQANIRFENNDQIVNLINKILLPMGKSVDSRNPMVEARLEDGSRIIAVIPPVAVDGPLLTISKIGHHTYSVDDLIQMGCLPEYLEQFLEACVVSNLNILITGCNGAGKSTLLNAIAGFIPEKERIVTIEDSIELKLQQSHVIRMETRLAESEGGKTVDMRDLILNATRMRPDRIIIGEIQGMECQELLRAINSGIDGLLTTLRANSARDAITWLESMLKMAGNDMPVRFIRTQIASAIDLIIHISQFKGGRRCITSITEVSGMESDEIITTDIFKFEQTGVNSEGGVIGELKPTGIRPLFTPRLEVYGFSLPPDVFGIHLADIIREQ